MRGTFDYKTDAYPFGTTFIGDDIAVINHLTDEVFEREARAETSELRVQQGERFERLAIRRKQAQLVARDAEQQRATVTA